MTSPSSYFPETFNLSDGPVGAVTTSQTDPRVVYDKNGFRATDVNGALLFSLDAVAGSADFKGHLKAKGLDLDATVDANPLAQDEVRWLRASDGQAVAFISGAWSPGISATYGILQLGANNPDNNADFSRILMHAGESPAGGAGESDVIIQTKDHVDGVLRQRLLYDSHGRSEFRPQGTSGIFTWPGGSVFSNALTIPHNLGVSPRTVGFSTISTGPGSFLVFHFQAPDPTNLYLQAVVTPGGAPGAGVQGTFYWSAWP